MGKRVFFLLFLFCASTAGVIGQLLSVDSAEVFIVIPEYHKKELITNQDTLAETGDAEVLTDFLMMDSLLAVKHFFSSGRIQIETDNFYNQIVRNQTLQMWIRGRLFSAGISTTSYNPWSLSLWWEEPGKFKPFVFSQKYKSEDYNELMEFNSSYSLTPFEKYQSFLEHPLGADTLIYFRSQTPVKTLLKRMLFEKPLFTDEMWDEIPDPPGFSFGGGHIENRSASESIETLLHWDRPETKYQLDKQEEKQRIWTYGGTENIQVSQAFQENWVKGGENSISLLSDLRLQARYKKDEVEWDSYIIQKLGILNTEEKEARFNDDMIELNTKYGLSAGKKWFYSGLINFKTQFFNGYDSGDEEKENPVSGLMAPGYLTLAVGMDYKEDKFTLTLLPITSKMTIVFDTVKIDQTNYKIPEDRKVDNMGGASFVNSFEWEISDDFNLQSKMDFFYEYMRRDNQIQAEWELIFDMQINVFLSARIGTYLRYYSNESEYVQFRENLSISFNYRF
jgi:hypothetical protein